MNNATQEMPRYRCTKKVWALKIEDIAYDSTAAAIEDRDTDGSAMLTFEDLNYGAIKVSAEYVRKHDPLPGGYYVVYKDGYQSWSPADAFEDGYTKIS